MRRLLLAFVPLLLVPLPASATGSGLRADCNYTFVLPPDSTDFALVVVADAVAGTDPAVTTSVTCTVTIGSINPTSFTVTGTSLGQAVVASGSLAVAPVPPVTVCWTPSAVYLTGLYATTTVTGSKFCKTS